MKIRLLFYGFLLLVFHQCTPMKKSRPSETIVTASANNSDLLSTLISKDELLHKVTSDKEQYKVQIIYTQIDRKNDNTPVFTEHYFDVNDSNYFYPASTIKFPIAILALHKVNEMKVPSLKEATMVTGASFRGQTEVHNDPTAPDGRPTILHYIKKILLVSDNDASNRLYEFLGQQYINDTLREKGYKGVQIIHRLSIALDEEQNRTTNPITFFDTAGRQQLLQQPKYSSIEYEKRKTFLGKGFYRSGELVNEPFDFSRKNKLPLSTLHQLLRAVIFPQSLPEKQRFNLTPDDLAFLRKYMSMYSNESIHPQYDTANYGPNYIKFILAGGSKDPLPDGIRIFNKSGQAYGFLTDMAYVIDLKNNIEFMITATIHCNSDGIYNDDNYDYQSIGFPFFQKLGHALYDHELNRKRRHVPDLSDFRFDYE